MVTQINQDTSEIESLFARLEADMKLAEEGKGNPADVAQLMIKLQDFISNLDGIMKQIGMSSGKVADMQTKLNSIESEVNKFDSSDDKKAAQDAQAGSTDASDAMNDVLNYFETTVYYQGIKASEMLEKDLNDPQGLKLLEQYMNEITKNLTGSHFAKVVASLESAYKNFLSGKTKTNLTALEQAIANVNNALQSDSSK